MLIRFLVFCSILKCSAVMAEGKRIALSFDDAPRPNTNYLTGAERTSQLILQLHLANAPSVGFFCNSDKISNENEYRLLDYARAGHKIANHTHSHIDANKTPLDTFVADIALAHNHLKDRLGFVPLFRFPFLRTGGEVEKRDAIREALKLRGYRHGYVTIDTYDWYMDSLLQKAIAAGAEMNVGKTRTAYVDMIMDSVRFYESLATKLMDSAPIHVLLLHENDLAAFFVGDLVRALRKEDWEVVSIMSAYKDKIAEYEPKTLVEGQGLIAAYALDHGYSGPVVSRYESEEEIEREFVQRGVFDLFKD